MIKLRKKNAEEAMPRVICHMVVSKDGKVTGDFLQASECVAATELYYELNRAFEANAFACGRVTMEESFTGGWYPNLERFQTISISKRDYVADSKDSRYAVAFDRRGRLGWKTSHISDEDPGYNKAHIIEVLCETVPDAYLAYLRSIGVSYIFAGENELDLHLALTKLRSLFGIRTLLLEGGSILNGAFHRAGLIDEVSLVMAPITASDTDKPLFYNCSNEGYVKTYIQSYDDGMLWIKGKRKDNKKKK